LIFFVSDGAFQGKHLTQENIIPFVSAINKLELRQAIVEYANKNDPLVNMDLILEKAKFSISIKKELNFNYRLRAVPLPVETREWFLQTCYLIPLVSELVLEISCHLTGLSNKNDIEQLMLGLNNHLFGLVNKEGSLVDKFITSPVNTVFSFFKSEEEIKNKSMTHSKNFQQRTEKIKKLLS